VEPVAAADICVTMKVAVAVGLVVSVSVLGTAAFARAPAPLSAVSETIEAAVKKPGVKARASKADTDPMAAPPVYSAEAVGWRLIEDPATGARLGLPEKLVPRVGSAQAGSRWTSTQGQIQVETFRLTEAALPVLFEEEKKAAHRQIASSVLKPDGFIIAGTQGLKNFVVRADARGSEVRGITILYDQATEGTMSAVSVAMTNAFVGFPDPNAMPPPGLRRMVEYGSAIVVGTDGYLIAPLHVTDDCRAITVPPLGHAARLVDDKANDLALLRVYGARNLVAATLAEDSTPGADVTITGVADPLAQGGNAETTSSAARVTAQGIDPAPKLGFSGAAVADTRGRLVGMVDLKAPAVAGGSTNQAATLVPLDAIRALLRSQEIVPSATAAPIAQSVVRVICVRK
jgi:hypothetical protein